MCYLLSKTKSQATLHQLIVVLLNFQCRMVKCCFSGTQLLQGLQRMQLLSKPTRESFLFASCLFLTRPWPLRLTATCQDTLHRTHAVHKTSNLDEVPVYNCDPKNTSCLLRYMARVMCNLCL